MRIALIIFLIALPLAVEAQEDDWLWQTMKVFRIGGGIGDYVTTQKALSLPNTREGNPVSRIYTDNLILHFAIANSAMVLQDMLLDSLYRKSKVLAYVVDAVLIVALSYAVYNNLRIINQ